MQLFDLKGKTAITTPYKEVDVIKSGSGAQKSARTPSSSKHSRSRAIL